MTSLKIAGIAALGLALLAGGVGAERAGQSWRERLATTSAPLIEPPLPAARNGYRQVGVASWYGPGFHGRTTASGETFDQNRLTAAHRTLPLGARITVTNLDNGRSVEVRINDRGPYAGDRVVDLSRAAAVRLGMVGNGTARVRIAAPPGQIAASSRG